MDKNMCKIGRKGTDNVRSLRKMGTWTISISGGKGKNLRAGEYATFVLRYENKVALRGGAYLRVACYANGIGLLQNRHPREDNFLSVRCPGHCELEVSVEERSYRSITHLKTAKNSDLYIIQLQIKNGILREKDVIEIVMGDRSFGSKGLLLPKISDIPLQFFYHIDPAGEFQFTPVNKEAPQYLELLNAAQDAFPQWGKIYPAVNIQPREPERLDLRVPSIVSGGETVKAKIVAYDRYYNVVRGYEETVECVGVGDILPRKRRIMVKTGEKGYCDCRLKVSEKSSQGILFCRAHNIGIFRSNPVIIVKRSSGKEDSGEDNTRVFWGDLHGHSSLSDGIARDENDFFYYARNIRGLDFAALADHSFGLAVKGHWERLRKAIRKHTREGEFVAILGWEGMFKGFGHRNIYFRDDEGMIFMVDYQPGSGGSFEGEDVKAYKKIWSQDIEKVKDMEKLFRLLKGKEFIWTAHHFGNLHPAERELLSLYEVCSEWGISDNHPRKNNSSTPIQAVFKLGLNPGLTGGSDDHTARAGFLGHNIRKGPIRYPSGLTAVVCERLTREEIFRSLRQKKCYATTGARIIIKTKSSMGKYFSVSMKIWGSDVIDRIQVFKKGEMVHEKMGASEHETLAWEDREYKRGDNYYVRIIQMDNQIAWINPMHFAE